MSKAQSPETKTGAKPSRAPQSPAPRSDDRALPAGADPHDDDMPEDIDQFRLEFAAKIRTFIGFWRDCPRPICQRSKACQARGERCGGKPEEPPMTEAERRARSDEARIKIRRAMDRRFAELGIDPKDY